METMTALVSHLDEQAFLPYQFEVAIPLIFFAGAHAASAYDESDWEAASVCFLLLAVLTLLVLSSRGSYPHLASVGLQLLLSGWQSSHLHGREIIKPSPG